MKKLFPVLVVCLFLYQFAAAQTKVFKEVSSEISTETGAIIQDGNLIGYLSFTELERVNADSFRYKITDENLNDIGVIDFKEARLHLAAISFEQDVLCLAYLKSNFIGEEFKNRRAYKNAAEEGAVYIYTQFISLNGKIIKTNAIKADVALKRSTTTGSKSVGTVDLKHDIQATNIPGKGFVCFYGDDSKNNLLVYNPAGEQIWQKKVNEEADYYGLLTASNEIFLLLKRKEPYLPEAGYKLLGYNVTTNTTHSPYLLRDKKGNQLKVMAFANDPATGRPYLSGSIINPRTQKTVPVSLKDYSKGPYIGVFTININGPDKKDREEICSYWGDGSLPEISKRGRNESNKTYSVLTRSFKDYQGNTYFAGNSFVRKTRWGCITSSVLTAPLLIPPIWILSAGGTSKCAYKDAMLLQQNAKGTLRTHSYIPGEHSRYHIAALPLSYYTNGAKGFRLVTNTDSKTNYLIIKDTKNTLVYNINESKLIRTIPVKDGNIITRVYAAKEGHVMIEETNKKEKYTRMSIEAL
jgi:hypothetical protein